MHLSQRTEIRWAAAALSAAALSVTASLISGTSFTVIVSAMCGAFLLFLFTCIDDIAPVPRKEFFVSGESSIIALTIFFSTILIGHFSIYAAGISFSVYLFCDFIFVRKRCSDSRDILFTGFLVHSVALIITFFLILRGVLTINQITNIFSGQNTFSLFYSFIIALAVFSFIGLFFFLRNQVKGYLSPVAAAQIQPRYWFMYSLIIIFRDISLFAAFCFSGICIIPFNVLKAESPVISQAIKLSLFIAVTESAAAAINCGFGLIAVIISATAPYAIHAITSRRRNAHAVSQRSFISYQR